MAAPSCLPLRIEFRLTGYGWAAVGVTTGAQGVLFPVSYLSDPLGTLAQAACDMVAGLPEAEFTMLAEPGFTDWLVSRCGPDVEVEITSDCGTSDPDVLRGFGAGARRPTDAVETESPTVGQGGAGAGGLLVGSAEGLAAECPGCRRAGPTGAAVVAASPATPDDAPAPTGGGASPDRPRAGCDAGAGRGARTGRDARTGCAPACADGAPRGPAGSPDDPTAAREEPGAAPGDTGAAPEEPGAAPEDAVQYHTVFARVPVAVFVGAVLGALDRVRLRYGEAGYVAQWGGETPFPMTAYRTLARWAAAHAR